MFSLRKTFLCTAVKFVSRSERPFFFSRKIERSESSDARGARSEELSDVAVRCFLYIERRSAWLLSKRDARHTAKDCSRLRRVMQNYLLGLCGAMIFVPIREMSVYCIFEASFKTR